MFKTYLSLTKPGIIIGNLIAATGGFLLASQGSPSLTLYLLTMLGISLVIASGCVYNNVIDTDIDSKMSRTQSRALVAGRVSRQAALFYATVLGLFGFLTLYVSTNWLTLIFAAFGFSVYVVLYSLLFKRRSVHGTFVGSWSGATPPVMGYTAVTNELDTAAILIFLAFCAWQMPHSYAIGLFRREDHTASNIPLLPLVRGLSTTQWHMVGYIGLFTVAVWGLTYTGFTGWVTAVVVGAMCIYWLYQTIAYFKPADSDFDATVWGRQLFVTSIFTITVFSIMVSIDYLLI